MKELTYIELKPWLTEKYRLWIEDDAMRNTEGHERVSQAWGRLFNCTYPNRDSAVATTDWGDAGGYIFADGRVSFWSYDGGSIYQIPEVGMQALGLSEVLPYPRHTLPKAPEGTEWIYRGMGWTNSMKPARFYTVDADGKTSKAYLSGDYTPSGNFDFHYFEAVPIIVMEDSCDPKSAAAAHKAPLHLLPSHPLHETAHVMRYGAERYGPWNWRENKVAASVYRSAMQRHLDQWFDGLEDADPETGRSHLAHVIASACIVMDAMKHETLIDDRPQTK